MNRNQTVVRRLIESAILIAIGTVLSELKIDMPLGGGLTVCSMLPLVLLGNPALFLAVYTVVLLGRTFVDYSVPSVLRFAVPVEIAGPYNAWRMLLHNGGTLLATTVAAVIPVEVLLILTVILQLYSGAVYFFEKKLREAV